MQHIVEEVGCNNYTTFPRSFIKRYGVNPMDYANFRNTEEASVTKSYSKMISISIFIFALIISLPSSSIAQNQKKIPGYSQFKASRDSLENLLSKTPESDGKRRLTILNNLYDIDLIFGESTYRMQLWDEAVRQKDINTIDDIAVSMAMRYMRLGIQDSVDLWIDNNNRHMPEPRRTENIEYLKLRRDIQNLNEQDQLALKLIKEQVEINPKQEPYRAMRVLYSLAVIANRGVGTTVSEKLKPSREYKAEALAIAETLPFRDAAHFHGQILLGMSGLNADYAKRFYDFNCQLLNEPDLRDRPFYSRLRIAASLEGLIVVGSELPRSELDGYYAQLQQLIRTRPQDTPCAWDQFNARVNYYYNRSIDNPEESLRWSDSLIAILPKYDLPTHYQKSLRAQLLGRLGRWEQAYNASNEMLAIKDSLNAMGTEEKIAELQTQYDVDRFRLEKKVKQQQLWYALLGCVLLAVLAALLWYHARVIARKNRSLCQQLESTSAAQRKMEQMHRDSAGERRASTRPDELSLIERLDELMHTKKRYTHSELSRDSIAAELATNRTYLNAAIREAYNQTFPEYIAAFRLSAAIELIEMNRGKSNMQNIAEEVGYTNYTTFYRSFIKRYGVKPMDYVNFLNKKEKAPVVEPE